MVTIQMDGISHPFGHGLSDNRVRPILFHDVFEIQIVYRERLSVVADALTYPEADFGVDGIGIRRIHLLAHGHIGCVRTCFKVEVGTCLGHPLVGSGNGV